MGNKENSINLLQTEKKSMLEQVLSWTLTVGRVLVLLTEAIALIAFLYRFGLDMRLVDLKDEIKPLQIYVKQKQPREEIFRDLQDRLRLVKKYDTSAAKTNELYQKMIEAARGKLVFNSISMTSDTIRIDALTRTSGSMSSYITTLRSYPQVHSISVDKIENKPASAQIGLVMTITLVKK